MEDRVLELFEKQSVMMEEIVKQNAILSGALLEKSANTVNKTAGSTHTAIRLHGQGGIFSTPGLDRDVITAMVRPHGIASVLPALPTVYEDPRFPSVTGYTDVIGTQPANACDDAPYNFMKGCNLTAMFGSKRFDTNTVDIEETIIKLNRGETTDLMLHGNLLTNMNLRPGNMNDQQVVDLLVMAEMVGVGVAFERALSGDLWTGTVAGGTFPGLDVQIATGQKDADTGTLCPALDSDVKDFNWNNIAGTAADIVEYVSMLHWYLQYNAQTMGLDPVEWVIVVAPNLWFELSAVWPCSYLSNRCKNSSGTQIAVINDNVNVNERDRMRNSMILPVNGVDIPVVVDSGIYEYCGDPSKSCYNSNLNSGEFASALYMVPLSIRGGFQSTYIQYLDYRQANSERALLNGSESFFWTDDGRYSWAYEENKWCFKLAGRTKQRVVLRTPHLAGKIQRIKYLPLQHVRDVSPTGPYYADGGVSVRGHTFSQAVWDTGDAR